MSNALQLNLCMYFADAVKKYNKIYYCPMPDIFTSQI